MGRNLDAGAELLCAGIKADISVQGPPRSEPGHVPRRDTGDLFRSYFHQTDFAGLQAVVGSPDPAAYWLEVGTSSMLPRPHILQAVVGRMSELAAALGKPL